MKRHAFAMLLLLLSPHALAHPGEHHGGFLSAVAHLLSEPDHLAMALLAGVVGVAGARRYRRHARGRVHDKRA